MRLDGTQKAGIVLSTSLNPWSMYFIWPKNTNGVGYPVAVNQTNAWWLGPSTAYVGETVYVYGRNLSNQNGTTNSWIYIMPPGYAGQWVTPTSVNPYKVGFTVPSLANGSYQVWIHNGHGEHYGWSGPLTLTVYTPTAWSSTQYNVMSYGATGNGVHRRHRGHRIRGGRGERQPVLDGLLPGGHL